MAVRRRASCAREADVCTNSQTTRPSTATLEGLINHAGGPLVARLARTPGRRDFEYMHLFSGPIDSVPADVGAACIVADAGRESIESVGTRIAHRALEQELQN